jgi:BirA family transcriptional regulator, biotin operon repressor / biotin---[acetyl-CoA-carboxylase] ligase
MPLRQPALPWHHAVPQTLAAQLMDTRHPTTPHLHWGAESLWEQLLPVLPGLSVEVVARLDSTNTRLLERARAASGDQDAPVTRPGELDGHGEPAMRTPLGRRAADLAPCLLVAEDQTAGRGRLGRDWVSMAGRSLTFSLALPLQPRQWGGLSLAVGVALADALEPAPASPHPAAPRLLLKWPNDLWLRDPAAPGGGRKLGGILIETVAVGNQRMVVVGVGLNVMPPAAPHEGAGSAALPALSHGWADLQELQPEISAPAALAAVALPLAHTLKRFEREGFAPFRAAWSARDLLAGRAVSVSGGMPLEGVADGVDDQGSLLVRGAAGAQRVVSGEASVRVTTA